MADKKQFEASKIDALYSWLSYDLQKIKNELLNEMKYSSVQVGSLYQEIKGDREKSSQAIAQEIRYSYKQNQTIYDGLAAMLSEQVGQRLDSMDEKATSIADVQNAVAEVLAKLSEVQSGVSVLETFNADTLAESVKEKVAEVLPQLEEAVGELKYSFMQHQSIYEGLTSLISGEVVTKINDVETKLAALEQIDRSLEDIDRRVAEGVAAFEDADYKTVIESVAEKTEESVSEHSRQILDAVAAIPVAENVDYNRIVDEVGDKMLEILGEVVAQEPAPAPVAATEPVEAKIDYDKIVYGTAEKVVESLPYPEKVDYRRIDERFMKAAEKVQINVGEDVIASVVSLAVEKAMAALDVEAIAAAVAERVALPEISVPEAPQIDYDKLADMVAERLAAKNEELAEKIAANNNELADTIVENNDKLADKVAEKVGQIENVDYDRISAMYVPTEEVDYDRIAAIVEEKTAKDPVEPTYELVVDDEGIQSIAEGISERLCNMCAECMLVPAEEEAVTEETTEVAQEEIAVEETVEEAKEEVKEESPAPSDELAVSLSDEYQEINDQFVDAETGLVIRLKKSFTAKMKQSEENVKGYYSDIKNELTSYKKINSNVSWHGDRFNYGRDTIAKVNISGKTLCFYLDLDPEDPEFKQTVYHQKNVGAQKAYEHTPFMMKIRSDAAAKKALRLVGYLAEKYGAEKNEKFEPTDYVSEFAYASTKQLFDDGYIKVTKEKKVEFDF
ncbi:MAG: hypothetical protein IJX91_00515 [Clostridia bacterium]|nr:hypothetical protein [Clostridia bacterium]